MIYMISMSLFSVRLPPGCPHGVQKRHGPGVAAVSEPGSVVELGRLSQGFYCVNEATCSASFPSGQP